MVAESIHQEDRIIINVYIPKNNASKYTKQAGECCSSGDTLA
jgi:hypothetical protein